LSAAASLCRVAMEVYRQFLLLRAQEAVGGADTWCLLIPGYAIHHANQNRTCRTCSGRRPQSEAHLGASSNVWLHDENDVTTTLGALMAMVRFCPSRRGHFSLLGGLGVKRPQNWQERQSDAANLVGLDYDGEGTSFTHSA
jgi:hypothetical protein